MSSNEQELKAREQDISGATPEVVEQAADAAGTGAVSGYKKIEDGVVAGYKKIENGVVTGYKKIEDGVVSGFGKVVDKCVEVLFAKEGETVAEAKARLSGKAESENK